MAFEVWGFVFGSGRAGSGFQAQFGDSISRSLRVPVTLLRNPRVQAPLKFRAAMSTDGLEPRARL